MRGNDEAVWKTLYRIERVCCVFVKAWLPAACLTPVSVEVSISVGVIKSSASLLKLLMSSKRTLVQKTWKFSLHKVTVFCFRALES